jgi:hypothetical protein
MSDPTIVQLPDIVLGTIGKSQHGDRLLLDAVNAAKPQKTYFYNSVISEPEKLPDGSATNTKVVITSMQYTGFIYKTNVYYNRHSSKDLGPVSVKIIREITTRDTIGIINKFLGTFIPAEIILDSVLGLPNGAGFIIFNLVFVQSTLQYYPGKRVRLLSDPVDPPPNPGEETEPTYSATWIKTDW